MPSILIKSLGVLNLSDYSKRPSNDLILIQQALHSAKSNRSPNEQEINLLNNFLITYNATNSPQPTKLMFKRVLAPVVKEVKTGSNISHIGHVGHLGNANQAQLTPQEVDATLRRVPKTK